MKAIGTILLAAAIAGLALILIVASQVYAHTPSRTAEFTPTYKIVTTYRNIEECRQVEGDALGGAILGGLLGSAVGNGLSSQDGAGTVGTALGAIIGLENSKPRTECTTRRVPNGTFREITGYELYIDGHKYWVPVQ